MGYERLNLKKKDIFKAAHVKHIEDAIYDIDKLIISTENVSLFKQTVEGFEYNSSAGTYIKVITPSPCILELENEYVVSWDGNLYTCTSFLANVNGYDMVAIGNKVLAGSENTNEPFAIAYNASTDFLNIFCLTTQNFHNIEIYQKVSKIKSQFELLNSSSEQIGVNVSENPYDGTTFMYSIKTDGHIAVVSFFWMMATLQTITMGDSINITINNSCPIFNKLYNALNGNFNVFGQFNHITTNGYRFGVTCTYSPTTIQFKVISRETKTLSGTDYIGVLYTNNVI